MAAMQVVEVHGMVPVADRWQLSRRDGVRLVYRVDVNSSDNGTLFIAGVPEFINVEAPSLVRTADDSFRALPVQGGPLGYEVSAQNGEPLPYPLSNPARRRDLEPPPKLDARIPALGRAWSGIGTDLERALRIQDRLRRDFTYSLNAGDRPVADPLANFLFVTRRGTANTSHRPWRFCCERRESRPVWRPAFKAATTTMFPDRGSCGLPTLTRGWKGGSKGAAG
jgi:hypothetical protein